MISNAHVLRHVQQHINNYLPILDKVIFASICRDLKWKEMTSKIQVNKKIRLASKIKRMMQTQGDYFHCTYCDQTTAISINVFKDKCIIRASTCGKTNTPTIITFISTHEFEHIYSVLTTFPSINESEPLYIACGKI